MNILILAATAFELNSIKDKLKNINKKEKNNIQFSFFCTGIGNFETIYSFTKFLENSNKEFDFILNLGICGYKNLKEDEKNNVFQIGRIFGGAKEKEFLIPQFVNFGNLSSVYSSEKIIYDKDKIKDKNINLIEMESFGIEYILEKTGIPRLYLKFPFDKIGSSNTKNFKEKLPKIKNILQENIDYKKLFQKIEKFLKNNSEKNFENKFKKEFIFLEKNSDKIGNLTFQEKNIFEKLFFKYETLSGKKIFEILKKFLNSEEKKLGKKGKKILLEKINSKIEKHLV